MKRIFFINAIAAVFILAFTGCIKNDPVLINVVKAEFDATALNANAAGKTFPIIPRIPGFGRAVSTSLDSTLRRSSGTISIRINLVGRQSSKEETVSYSVSPVSGLDSTIFPATIAGQSPTAPSGKIFITNAVAGTHYSALSGLVTIPANSSFGFLTINILNPGATPAAGRYLGLKLTELGTIKPSFNYSELGLIIDQR